MNLCSITKDIEQILSLTVFIYIYLILFQSNDARHVMREMEGYKMGTVVNKKQILFAKGEA